MDQYRAVINYPNPETVTLPKCNPRAFSYSGREYEITNETFYGYTVYRYKRDLDPLTARSMVKASPKVPDPTEQLVGALQWLLDILADEVPETADAGGTFEAMINAGRVLREHGGSIASEYLGIYMDTIP